MLTSLSTFLDAHFSIPHRCLHHPLSIRSSREHDSPLSIRSLPAASWTGAVWEFEIGMGELVVGLYCYWDDSYSGAILEVWGGFEDED